jgi:CDP-diacylglycerol--serine O-phosphatidyltransferase
LFSPFRATLVVAAYAIFLSSIFDFFDGLASRVLNSYSFIGKDLDSLADMVSFGVLPSVIMYELFLQAPQINGISQILNFVAFLLPVFSALRLAKFNNDTRQSDSFIGLPTPANAILDSIVAFNSTTVRCFGALHFKSLLPYSFSINNVYAAGIRNTAHVA